MFKCGNYIDLTLILKKFPFIHIINSTVNLKYYGRFSLAQYVSSNYVYIVDDDVIPSVEWLNICKSMCDEMNVILSSAGRIIPKDDLYPERLTNAHKYFIGDINNNYQHNFCPQNTIVDFGCNSWFLKTEWLK